MKRQLAWILFCIVMLCGCTAGAPLATQGQTKPTTTQSTQPSSAPSQPTLPPETEPTATQPAPTQPPAVTYENSRLDITFCVVAEGIQVMDLEPGGSADAAGMMEGDIVTRLAGIAVVSQSSLNSALSNACSGATVPVEILRQGEPVQLELVLDVGLGKQGILAEYVSWYEKCQDVVGWIRIPGIKTDDPVMQTPGNKNYYLDHDINGNKNKYGELYIREQCDVFAPSDNLVIYGHHMKDGTMFGQLDKYLNESFWESHQYIYFDTLYEKQTYRIFAVFKTSANPGAGFSYYKFNDAADAQEFDAYVATCKELSFYDTGITPVYGDKLITLSTCEYTLSNGRFVVVAVRVS